MENILYPILISFIFIFISELGDKTQLLILSFSSKTKISNILIGIAIGSFFSHGIAIIFGSTLNIFKDKNIEIIIKSITYILFVIIGILILLKKENTNDNENKFNLLKKINSLNLNYLLIIAISIALGEFGDKTFLVSIGLGIEYSEYKVSLIIGAILGMVLSNLLAIILGKLLNKYFSNNIIENISGILFLIFGFIGFVNIII